MSKMDWPTAVPWIVAAFGWGATHLLSEARERRKEIRSQLDKYFQMISLLEQDAVEYHSAAAFDKRNAGKIMSKLDKAERALQRIPFVCDVNLAPEFMRLRRAMTLRNMDSSKYKAQEPESELLLGIADAVYAFESRIESIYLHEYPSRFPYFIGRVPRIRLSQKN